MVLANDILSAWCFTLYVITKKLENIFIQSFPMWKIWNLSPTPWYEVNRVSLRTICSYCWFMLYIISSLVN